MVKNLKKQQSGFTIIEVLIVLAIAGLIMLVVFLAVPALQRNSRNSQRNSDASLVLAAMNECVNNKNGQITSCDSNAELIPAFLDTAKLRQLTTVAYNVALPPTANTTTVNIAIQRRCVPDGSAPTATGATPRQFSAVFNIENTAGTGIGRCIES